MIPALVLTSLLVASPPRSSWWQSEDGPSVQVGDTRIGTNEGGYGWATYGGVPQQMRNQVLVAEPGGRSEYYLRYFEQSVAECVVVMRLDIRVFAHENLPGEVDSFVELPACPRGFELFDTTGWDEDIRECVDMVGSRGLAFGLGDAAIRWFEVSSDERITVPEDELSRDAQVRGMCSAWGLSLIRRPARSYAVEVTYALGSDAIVSVQEHRDGVRDGAFVVYHDNGRPAVIGNYLDGDEQGPWLWLDPNGDAVTAVWFEHGVAYERLIVRTDRVYVPDARSDAP